MSHARDTTEPDDESNPWERLAEHRDVLEMCIEENTPFAEDAQRLLDYLDEEGY